MTPVMTAADLEDMPQHQKDALCAWVISMTKAVFSQPGVEEEYQRWLAEYRAKIANKQERRIEP